MQTTETQSSRLTRTLLTCGVLTGPVFFAVASVQALTRPGYDIRLNAISQLSLGELGWMQITSFLLAGLLAVAAASGVRRKLKGQKGGAWGALLTGTFGLGLIVAGIFPPDPAFGFPPGAPEGPAMPMSGIAALHAVGFFVSMLSLIVNCFVFVRRFGSTGQRGWLVYSVVSAVATVALIALTNVFMSWAGVIVALAGAVAFGWVSAVSAGLRVSYS
jgi:hypothetical protein